VSGVVQRTLLVLAGLAVLGWLAVSLHDSRLLDRARALSLEPRPDTREGLELARRARLLNPDYTERGTLIALFHARAGRLDLARRDIEAVIRREPQNPGAWVILADLTQRSDPALAARARARARSLNGGFVRR
jgi:hypothetical protein